MSILCVGSVALDSVETPFGRAERVVGGSAVYFSVAAANFAGVRLVGVVGGDFAGGDLDLLAARGVDCAGVETVLLADLDPAHVASTRDHFRFLQDRR